jgi:hypothetical protein
VNPLSISIVILQDTSFKFSKITPTAFGVDSPIDPLPATGSGIEGAISIGSTNIPPNVLVLVSDQSFSSNASLANTLNSDAIATARTADLQANAGDVQECEPTGTKKPLLTITASLPSVPTRTAQNPNRSSLPPCKE